MPAAALRRSALIASVLSSIHGYGTKMPGDASREVSAGHISAENHFLQSPRVIWCLAGSHPLLKPLPPVRIRRSEVGETLREITALGKSQPTLLHFGGSRLSALVGRLVGRTLGVKRPVETQLGLLTELLKHRTRPSSFEPAYDTRANLLTA
jgi:hypothetical protein